MSEHYAQCLLIVVFTYGNSYEDWRDKNIIKRVSREMTSEMDSFNAA